MTETIDRSWAGEEWRNTWTPQEKNTLQGYTKAMHLTEEQIEGVLSELEEGTPIHEASRKYGTSSTQWFRRVKRDPELHRRALAAQEEGKGSQQENIRSMAWVEARNGNAKMIERLAIVMLPEWREALTTSRLQVGNIDGEAFKMAALKQFGASLSDKDLETMIEIMERASSQGETLELPLTTNGSD